MVHPKKKQRIVTDKKEEDSQTRAFAVSDLIAPTKKKGIKKGKEPQSSDYVLSSIIPSFPHSEIGGNTERQLDATCKLLENIEEPRPEKVSSPATTFGFPAENTDWIAHEPRTFMDYQNNQGYSFNSGLGADSHHLGLDINQFLERANTYAPTVIPAGPSEAYDIDAKFICHQNLLQYTTEYYPKAKLLSGFELWRSLYQREKRLKGCRLWRLNHSNLRAGFFNQLYLWLSVSVSDLKWSRRTFEKAILFMDLHMQKKKGFSEVDAIMVLGAMLLLAAQQENEPIDLDAYFKHFSQIITSGAYEGNTMDKEKCVFPETMIHWEMNEIIKNFLDLWPNTLYLPIPSDWCLIYIRNAFLMRPDLFACPYSPTEIGASKLYQLVEVMEHVCWHPSTHQFSDSSKAATVFLILFGGYFSEHDFKAVTGYSHNQLRVLYRPLNAIYNNLNFHQGQHKFADPGILPMNTHPTFSV